MHPLCIAMRGQHNYDRILDMHKGAIMNLRSIPGGRMTRYKRCSQPDPRSNFSPETIERSNLILVAALGGIGSPVLCFDGPEGSRRYWLPRFGYALFREDGTTYLEDAASPLFELAPTPQDPWALAVCFSDPLHPVAIAYNAVRSRIRLRDLLQHKKPRLLIQDGNLRAVITPNATGRVMGKISDRFGAPL